MKLEKRCLVICPTYNRPKQFCRMIESFYETSVCSDMIVLTAKGSITQLINAVDYSGYDYVSVTNDDFIYKTKAWDQILIDVLERKGGGIAFGNDGSNNSELPTTSIIDARITRAVGWVQYPKLIHLYGDTVWKVLGDYLKRIYYVHSVSIEHMHFMFGKADKEDYFYSNSQEMYKQDSIAFTNWIMHESREDERKIRAALGM